MNRYSVSPQARADVREIWKYIARENQPAANRLRARFKEVFFLLCRNPQLGQKCDELRIGLRFFCVGNYVIYYDVANHGIRIVRVRHGAQDAQSIF